ncbi:biotin carboxylase [Alkalihalobacillus alcalophilus ATCC 27647 = CGMCC 1.3604]|uniref:biotin carboxylase n=1 Tax=Alkalihalobacillus alcalophilus ATCC 27647 = CGMCC 1.3604 TaxID=1218173 RepID=A0A094WLE5_ALKAL|nr:acetyl-CoA carboxylase biotin carboxylase subunit [Alkalihalobacillus alcalophilus]KGA98584.1 biotin carboxylase [Alkalihalobacillus alcalophilus ATCC 27647 = CGMCC 1.3604]MED1560425.1 acetyl-CoA carboxylase biotin carboxylase subunit [Alkalihalobacillus alcalophilus]THG88977.1 biotin carboxylase [Alkalihalobacillus alcalophilus ATCC 27647 = CGMCC 1.3604]
MFQKILIANRGEIASRIMRTCKKLSIKTVAVYSEADSDSPFVKEADEAYLLGGSRVSESYLNIDKIIEIAKKTNVSAIHPGYGLLSENAEFVQRCEAEELVFIGPTADVIQKMGSKIEARKQMKKAGVPIVPGIEHPLTDVKEALLVAEEIGYPVMLKASAGGGGIGMQLAYDQAELEKAFVGNQKRALSFFGEGSMYMEKYIHNPRHIEVQILADKSGETIYLWERECSIQRRHQKVIEEAPSVFLTEETRKEMGEAAVKAARAIGYENAGTIEFIVDEQQNYYFLEMNTRLQVEHPVTEEITKLDLVEAQIDIAQGEPIILKQEDILNKGHAIEARIYAEDPKTFYPSPGTITTLKQPEGEGIRHEMAVKEGSVVTPFYDPMIAKLIVHADTREQAIEKMVHALNDYKIEGIKTNIPLLMEVFGHQAFQKGDTTTDFLNRYITVS